MADKKMHKRKTKGGGRSGSTFTPENLPGKVWMTAEGPVHLTPTSRAILAFIGEHAEKPISKEQIAVALGRNEKTIDRLVSRMRQQGIIVSVPMWSEKGGQLPNAYRITPEVKPEEDD